MNREIEKLPGGGIGWSHCEGDRYLVTGRTVNGKRFRAEYAHWPQAAGINLYEGRKYLVRDGKRTLLARVY